MYTYANGHIHYTSSRVSFLFFYTHGMRKLIHVCSIRDPIFACTRFSSRIAQPSLFLTPLQGHRWFALTRSTCRQPCTICAAAAAALPQRPSLVSCFLFEVRLGVNNFTLTKSYLLFVYRVNNKGGV